MTTLRTVGHGTASAEELLDRLRAAEVDTVVDVRIAPGSRRHPQFGRDALAQWLPEAGVGYRWEKRLGGFRKLPPDSPDVALRNDSFRAYAAHMRSAEFGAAVAELLAEAATGRVAVMCSETVWWRCHRRMIADFAVLARGVEVRHVMPGGRLAPHRPTDAARLREDGLLVYDVTGSPSAPSDGGSTPSSSSSSRSASSR
jgi:uncharacterized protein (DUF488 family)